MLAARTSSGAGLPPGVSITPITPRMVSIALAMFAVAALSGASCGSADDMLGDDEPNYYYDPDYNDNNDNNESEFYYEDGTPFTPENVRPPVVERELVSYHEYMARAQAIAQDAELTDPEKRTAMEAMIAAVRVRTVGKVLDITTDDDALLHGATVHLWMIDTQLYFDLPMLFMPEDHWQRWDRLVFIVRPADTGELVLGPMGIDEVIPNPGLDQPGEMNESGVPLPDFLAAYRGASIEERAQMIGDMVDAGEVWRGEGLIADAESREMLFDDVYVNVTTEAIRGYINAREWYPDDHPIEVTDPQAYELAEEGGRLVFYLEPAPVDTQTLSDELPRLWTRYWTLPDE